MLCFLLIFYFNQPSNYLPFVQLLYFFAPVVFVYFQSALVPSLLGLRSQRTYYISPSRFHLRTLAFPFSYLPFLCFFRLQLRHTLITFFSAILSRYHETISFVSQLVSRISHGYATFGCPKSVVSSLEQSCSCCRALQSSGRSHYVLP